MLFSKVITFSLLEWLAITGMTQCGLVLGYMVFRVRYWSQAFVPLLYFSFLASAFAMQLMLRLEGLEPYVHFGLWLAWMTGPPLCYVLVLQLARPERLPEARHFAFFLLIFLLPFVSMLINAGSCAEGFFNCAGFFDILYWLGALVGLVSMLAFWGQRGIFSDIAKAKSGQERYWLVILLIAMNIACVFLHLWRSVDQGADGRMDDIMVVMGIGFAYLISTAFLRVYPLPVVLNPSPKTVFLKPDERDIAERVRNLMTLDKVYHEHSFSRADMARELGVSENVLSKVINAHFGKSFPSLLSEYRVDDAKRMLKDAGIPIQVVASEVGFNSLASFNRVFRELTGETPSSYRERAVKEEENQAESVPLRSES
jgi:AraC-like DNA-binding protein